MCFTVFNPVGRDHPLARLGARDPFRTPPMNTTYAFFPGPHLSECLTAALHHPASMLRITVERNAAAVLLRAGGEIDAANADTWTCVLDEIAAATPAPGVLIVDITALEFMGSVGFAALADHAIGCRHRGIALRLISTHPTTARVITAGRWHTDLPLYPDLEAALYDCADHTDTASALTSTV